MLHNIKSVYLHCVFHGIRFKVNNEDWLSVMDGLFLSVIFCVIVTKDHRVLLVTSLKSKAISFG